MCRSIRRLYNLEPRASDEEVRAAARQFVRKVSGSTRPSKANEEAFEQAIDEIATSIRRLLRTLVTRAEPVRREVLEERARERWQRRRAGL